MIEWLRDPPVNELRRNAANGVFQMRTPGAVQLPAGRRRFRGTRKAAAKLNSSEDSTSQIYADDSFFLYIYGQQWFGFE
jgi:hypothetical protein